MRRSLFFTYCAAFPLAALIGGLAIAAYRSVYVVPDSPLISRPGWVWWAALGVGLALGAGFCVPQRRLLHRHRDFVAEQSNPGRRRGLGVEVRWLGIVWPILLAAIVAIVLAWWLGWPAVVMVLGVLGASILLFNECKSIQTLARRKAAGATDE